jgi:selenocysteine lyase
MHANNETGVIMPISEIGKKLEIINTNRGRQNLPQIYFHTDAAQTIGKINVDVKELQVDYLTVVGHKFYGTRIGALYARGVGKITPIIPIFVGGGQERNFRSGTENTCMIEGLGVAAELVRRNLEVFAEHMLKIREKLKSELQQNVPGVQINFENSETLPNTLSIAVPVGLTGAKVLELCGNQVCASLGAACHSSRSHQELESSTVLTFSGLTSEQAKRTIRLSVGRETSEDEIQVAVQCIASACNNSNN